MTDVLDDVELWKVNELMRLQEDYQRTIQENVQSGLLKGRNSAM
jgi:hypothetical protein